MISKLILDFSGVVQDDRHAVYWANKKFYSSFGKRIAPFEKYIAGCLVTAAERARKYGIQGSDEYLNGIYEKFYNEALGQGIRPEIYPDVKVTLKHLHDRGVLMSVVSSHPQRNLDAEIKEYGIAEFFDRIVGNSTNKSKDIVSLCDQFGIKGSYVLYVDDTAWGIKAAKASGVLSAGITTGYHPRKKLEAEKPDFIFESFSEIKDIRELSGPAEI